MAVKLLDDSELKALELEFRAYRQFKVNMATIMLNKEWKEPDENSWITSSRGHNEKALDDLIFKESNPAYQINLLKSIAVDKTMEKLSDELRQIVEKYMWGKYSYLPWREVAEKEFVSKSTIYDWRYKILETYAYEVGKLV